MKAKKKWSKLRKAIKICKRNENCKKCEIRHFCSEMSNSASISVYFLCKVEDYLKGFDKI